MILVGFTAVGLSVGRYALESLNMTPWRAHLLGYGSPLWLAWSLAFFLLRFRKPRPKACRLFRQPGASACLVGFISFLLWGAASILQLLFGTSSSDLLITYASLSAGPGIIGVWSLLWLTRTGRLEPGWIDRSGSVLGFGGIALMIITFIELFV
jgi:hypothetical protein